jgi:hypothetical protein
MYFDTKSYLKSTRNHMRKHEFTNAGEANELKNKG